jgi:hypothetical protein
MTYVPRNKRVISRQRRSKEIPPFPKSQAKMKTEQPRKRPAVAEVMAGRLQKKAKKIANASVSASLTARQASNRYEAKPNASKGDAHGPREEVKDGAIWRSRSGKGLEPQYLP